MSQDSLRRQSPPPVLSNRRTSQLSDKVTPLKGLASIEMRSQSNLGPNSGLAKNASVARYQAKHRMPGFQERSAKIVNKYSQTIPNKYKQSLKTMSPERRAGQAMMDPQGHSEYLKSLNVEHSLGNRTPLIPRANMGAHLK
mgnify:CR=1 FL=1